MASPFFRNAMVYLKAADSPFSQLVQGAFRASLIVLTPAAAACTLTLFDALNTSGGDAVTVFIGTATANGPSVAFTFYAGKEIPFLTRVGLSATLTGTGAVAFIYTA